MNIMSEKNVQKDRLDFLVKKFCEDSIEYKDMEIPPEPEEKRRILSSLMNIRMPRKLSEDILQVQDAYLRERAAEKGIVSLDEIPTVKEYYGSSKPYAAGLSIWQGDITRLACDAIVNAANSQMLGCFVPMHTCIDNCIHTFAGIGLRLECSRQMNRLRELHGRDYEQPTAVPMLTDAYNLPAKKVIHIVGPIVQTHVTPELEKNLADCYRNTLELCLEHGLKSVAFCCISTGVFRFPNDRAAEIAVETVASWLSEHEGVMRRVIFNVFKDEDLQIYEDLLV